MPFAINLLPVIQEPLEELDTQTRIQRTRGRAHRVHAQLRQARIRGPDTHHAGQRRADGAAAARVVADHERLRLAARQLADAAEDGGGDGVGGHVAVAVGADDDALVELGDVLVEVAAEEVGVAGVGDVGGEEERLGVGLAEDARAVGLGVEGLDGALDDEGEEVAPGTLAEERANLLIVEEGSQLDTSLVLFV